MVTKQTLEPGSELTGSVLAKILMVTKPVVLSYLLSQRSVLAKILMVTKQENEK